MSRCAILRILNLFIEKKFISNELRERILNDYDSGDPVKVDGVLRYVRAVQNQINYKSPFLLYYNFDKGIK